MPVYTLRSQPGFGLVVKGVAKKNMFCKLHTEGSIKEQNSQTATEKAKERERDAGIEVCMVIGVYSYEHCAKKRAALQERKVSAFFFSDRFFVVALFVTQLRLYTDSS